MNVSRRSAIYPGLLAVLAGLLMVLPFVTTFNDLLASVASRIGLAGPLGALAPVEARLTVAALTLVGLPSAVNGPQVVLLGDRYAQPLTISWNCAGWQSVLLLALSLWAGLRREHTTTSRLLVIAFGGLGTVAVNVLRIGLVCLLAAAVGYVPAVLFHDYAGTLLTIGWLFVLWSVAFRWLLIRKVVAR
jgi:exosortase/archaeosortase family protein